LPGLFLRDWSCRIGRTRSPERPTAGTFIFTVRVTDDLGAFSEKELSITIN
jgi:hypothetical protein